MMDLSSRLKILEKENKEKTERLEKIEKFIKDLDLRDKFDQDDLQNRGIGKKWGLNMCEDLFGMILSGFLLLFTGYTVRPMIDFLLFKKEP